MVLRRLVPGDLDHFAALDADPEVMRYLTGGLPSTRDEVERYFVGLLSDRGRAPGHGVFAAEDRADGAFLGWFALQSAPGSGPARPELGYRMVRSAWGRGLATEGAIALVDLGFTRLGAERVHAETMAVNRASRRVMEKAGLRYVRTFHLVWDDPIPGTEHGEVEYAVTLSQWAARQLSLQAMHPN